MFRSAAVVAMMLAPIVAGCATITKGTEQAVIVTTPGVTGAQCTLNSSVIGTRVVSTPASITLPKSVEQISVRCRKECYQDGTGVIASNVEVMTAGNLIVGGVVGIGVDAMSGAMNSYNGENQIAMVPIQHCRAKA